MNPDEKWISYTNSHHYIIDGIPMKINSSFHPKEFKDDLPKDIRSNRNTSRALKFSYEFETEDGYISWYEDYIQEREAHQLERAKRLERARKDKELKESAKAKADLPAVTSSSHPTVVRKAKIPEPSGKMEPPPICNTILTPQRASPITVTASNHSNTSTSTVNVKDFENLGEDPFESAELNTINEMEELRSLLSQNVASKPPAPISQSVVTHSVTMGLSNGTSHSGNADILHTASERSSSDIYENVSESTRNDSCVYENMPITSTTVGTQPLSSPKLPIPAPRLCNSEPTTPETPQVANQELNFNSALSTEASDAKALQVKKPALKPKPKVPTIGLTYSDKVAALSASVHPDKIEPVKDKKVRLVGFSYTKGVKTQEPDAIKHIEWPSMDAQSPSTPPVTTSSVRNMLVAESRDPSMALGTTSGGKSTQQVKPSRPPPPAPKKTGKQQSTNLPKKNSGASKAVNGSAGNVTESLLAMGFDRVHINSAVHNLGDNTSTLVEHLCALQKLASNKSIRWQHAQEGLFLYHTDIEKAEKYARAYQQLSEIGFDADKIKSALIANDIDTEKALGQLVT